MIKCKADGTVVGHVPNSFLLGSLGQQSLLTLTWVIVMTAFCFVFRSSLLTRALVKAFDLKRMRLINQGLVTVIMYGLV